MFDISVQQDELMKSLSSIRNIVSKPKPKDEDNDFDIYVKIMTDWIYGGFFCISKKTVRFPELLVVL